MIVAPETKWVSRVTAEWISCICCVCVRITQLNLRLSCISLYRPARLTDSIFSHQCSRFLVVAQLHKALPHNPRLKGRLSSYSFHAIVFQSKKLLTDENSYRVMWTNRGVNGWNSSTYQARLEESFLFFFFSSSSPHCFICFPTHCGRGRKSILFA